MSFEKMKEFLLDFKEEDVSPEYIEYIVKYKTITTGAGIVHVLNKLVSLIDEDKCYVEVGTHKGSTLIGAGFKNKAKCYGVDNFIGHNSPKETYPFATVEEHLVHNLKTWDQPNISYFKSDFVEFLKDRKDVNGQKVEVYLYDGDHMRDTTFAGLLHGRDMLADKAIIILDDSANNDKEYVHGAVSDLMKIDNRISIIKEWIPKKMHGRMWCGLLALGFER